MRALQHAHQRGTAVIGALLITLAAMTAAAAVMERQGLLVDTLVGERERAQAEWVLRGGLDWARVILRSDGLRNATTRPDGVWAQPILGLQINEFADGRQALFSGRIEDEQGKYNLRRLVVQGDIVPREVETLARLLDSLDLPAELATAIAQRLLEAAPTENGPAQAPGLRRLSDLAALEGMSAARLRILHSYLTILPAATTVNVNTASAEVLDTLLPELALPDMRELVAQRDRGLWFNDTADFLNRLGANTDVGAGQFAVRSDWFLVSGEVAMDNTTVGMQALLHRYAGQAPTIRWMVNP